LELRNGKELIESYLDNMWKEGNKWYAVVKCRTHSHPTSRENPSVTIQIDEDSGEVVTASGFCRKDGTALGYVSHDFLTFRHAILQCRYCGPDGEDRAKYNDFGRRFQESSRLLQEHDDNKRAKGAILISKLVQDGIGLCGGWNMWVVTRGDDHRWGGETDLSTGRYIGR
jgi:hypothetical protein